MIRPSPAVLSFFFLLLLTGCATSREDIVPLNQSLSSEKLQKEDKERRELITRVLNDLEEKHVFYRNEALENYLQEVAVPFIQNLELGPETQFNFRILRDPTFNAGGYGTGHIHFHTGLFTRLKNEAQLAFVVGHEISHVYHRDDLYQLQNLKRKTVTFKVLDLLFTPPASFFGAGSISEVTLNLIYGASVTGYGREGEARADEFAMERMLETGYDVREVVQHFKDMIAEKERYKQGIEIFFLSDHPSNQSRKKAAEEWIRAHQKEIDAKGSGRKEAGKFLKLTYEIRRDNAKLNMDLGRYFHALEDVEKALKQNPSDPVAYYYRGEIYRSLPANRTKIEEELSDERWRTLKSVRKEEQDKEWQTNAIDSYQKAIEIDSTYAPSYRGLGVSYLDQKEFSKARAYFEKYLELAPQAKDRRSVVRYLEDIQELTQGKGVS